MAGKGDMPRPINYTKYIGGYEKIKGFVSKFNKKVIPCDTCEFDMTKQSNYKGCSKHMKNFNTSNKCRNFRLFIK